MHASHQVLAKTLGANTAPSAHSGLARQSAHDLLASKMALAEKSRHQENALRWPSTGALGSRPTQSAHVTGYFTCSPPCSDHWRSVKTPCGLFGVDPRSNHSIRVCLGFILVVKSFLRTRTGDRELLSTTDINLDEGISTYSINLPK